MASAAIPAAPRQIPILVVTSPGRLPNLAGDALPGTTLNPSADRHNSGDRADDERCQIVMQESGRDDRDDTQGNRDQFEEKS